MQPHSQQTHELMESEPVVLPVQDTTASDRSHHAKTKGLGQVGKEKRRGLLLPTVLAVVPLDLHALGGQSGPESSSADSRGGEQASAGSGSALSEPGPVLS